MTETQAKSGAAGASTNPVDEETASGGGAPSGRAVVGRAAVSPDAPSPKFTRAPGMPPPPDQLPGDASSPSARADGESEATSPLSTAGTGATTSPAGKTTTSKTPSAKSSPAGGDKADRSSRTDEATTRLEQPGSEIRTERIPLRGDRSTAPAGAGAETTQPITGSQPTFATGRAGGSTTQPGTSRFGLGGSTARTGAGSTAPGTVPGAGTTPGGAGAVGAARVTEAVRAARTTVSSAAARGPRRARLNLKRIDPWSVMKFSFAVSLVLFIVVIVATSVLYLALDAMGVFDSVNGTLTDMLAASGGSNESAFRITAKGVILTSGLIGLVNVVLFTALATLGAFIYNVCADLVGGIELTLAERD
ncbi:DUF3566 domain-containing protein [Plantactinospora sp. B5E13]|uniref:DUF3566 domain-containing protein n=1 Tax=unclassified Plantactinospora TaxID=2631981 RepID=UPI00325C500B